MKMKSMKVFCHWSKIDLDLNFERKREREKERKKERKRERERWREDRIKKRWTKVTVKKVKYFWKICIS
jgi:hypothetical protein